VQTPGAPSAVASDEELTREIVLLANRLISRLWVQHQARVAEFDLTIPEAKVLLSLEPGRRLSMRELAAALRANPSNVTVAVSRLEGRGLVGREGADDRRVKGVVLTEAGVGLRANLEARLMEDSPAVRGLSRRERETMRTILRRLDERAGIPATG
jgi:DNA-binding MarR family transcriptional regulator